MDSCLLRFVTIKHSCGHTVKYKPQGMLAARVRRVNLLKMSPCADCQEAYTNRKIDEHSAALGLPPMAGDVERYPFAKNFRLWLYGQPDWMLKKALDDAYKVRWQDYYRAIDQDRDKINAAARARTVESFRAWLRDHTDAQWWGRRQPDTALKTMALEYFDEIIIALTNDNQPGCPPETVD